MSPIERLSAMGNLMDLPGPFGVKWGFIQLRARFNALEAAVMDDHEPPVPLDWESLSASSRP
jgi:hypothetical protein